MSEIAHRFCRHATIIAVVTLIAGIAVAIDAIGSARSCSPLGAEIAACGPEPAAWPAATLAPREPVPVLGQG
ncbi:MAG: hypothetical protein ACFE0R_16515 [Salinarimonas sp.]